MLEKIQLKGHCYVLLQCNEVHPIAYQRHELIWYPERGMSLFEQHNYRPYVKSVVTENPWIVGLYDRTKVRIVGEDGTWTLPDIQTYGSDIGNILHHIMGIRSSIPAQVLDGGMYIETVIEDYKKAVKLAHRS